MAEAATKPGLRSRILGCLYGGLIGDAMGSPGEGKTYAEIDRLFGELNDFEGAGTDDTAIRLILIDAILQSGGNPRIDHLAEAFLRAKDRSYGLWWIPVKNMFHKLEAGLALPADAGYGNMHSSSTAMAFSPMGILNAADPARAARETYEIASLVHSGPAGFSRDAACAIAAAISAAFLPDATVDSVVVAASSHLLPISGKEMLGAIDSTLKLVDGTLDYKHFREAFYALPLREIIADPRETVPVALALFRLADGDTEKAIVYGANFGRDADTIATMVGSLAGAFSGFEAIPAKWREKAEAGAGAQYSQLTDTFVNLLGARRDAAKLYTDLLDGLLAS